MCNEWSPSYLGIERDPAEMFADRSVRSEKPSLSSPSATKIARVGVPNLPKIGLRPCQRLSGMRLGVVTRW